MAESFGHCFGGIMNTVAQGVQLEIMAKDGVTIKGVKTERPMERSTKRLVLPVSKKWLFLFVILQCFKAAKLSRKNESKRIV